MKRLVLFILLLVILINSGLSAQSKSENKLTFYDAESWILFEDYKEALPKYQQLLMLYPANSNFKYRIGQCYINIPGEKEKAISYLEDAVKNINPDYKEGKFRETGAPYDAFYYLANAYRINNQLDKAIETYKLFKKNLNTEVYDSNIVNLQIQSCLNAKELMNIPLFIKEKNLGSTINGSNSEFNPVVSDKEDMIVFSRSEAFYEAILFSAKINGQWSSPINMNELLRVDKDLYPSSMSEDGKTLYMYSSADYDGIIYSSQFENGVWSPYVKLNDNINSKYWESHATVSHDNKKLYFTTNRKGTLGGLDIYVSSRDSTGDWGPAVNLGPVINTPYNEESPFLSQDDKTLFFSSRGHFNMGGYDIFFSTLLDNGEWSVPRNVGYPMNSTDDDVFYNPLKEGFEGYYAKESPGGLRKLDIYRIEIFSDNHPRKFFVSGVVKIADLMSNIKDSVKISTMNIKAPGKTIVVHSNPKTGEYEFQAPQGNYQVTYEAEKSEKVVKSLALPLTHPSDSVVLPGIVLPKTDFIADLIVRSDRTITVTNGDSILFPLKVEPNAYLSVEHWVGDSLISGEQFFMSDSAFKYKMVPAVGDNKVVFKLTDRFNNSASTDIYITRTINVTRQSLIRPEDNRVTANKQIAAEILAVADPAILILKEKILLYGNSSPDGNLIRQSVATVDLNNIKLKEKWLQAFYDESVRQGLNDTRMTDMLVTISSIPGTKVDQYLRDLTDQSEEPLLSSLKSLDLKKEKITSPGGLLLYLIHNKDQVRYPEETVYKAIANLIIEKNLSAETIAAQLIPAQKGFSWILLVLLGTGLFIIFFIFRKRRKDKKE